MAELLRKQVSARSTRVWLLAWALVVLPALAALPAFAAVESLPASVRACAAETDSLRRLMCYDREVARFPAPLAKAAPTPQTEATTTAPAQAAPAPRVTPTPANVPTTEAAATTGAPPPAAASSASAGAGGATHSNPQHITARIVSIDHRPNELTWHLDNGQIWQEVQGVAGDLSLR